MRKPMIAGGAFALLCGLLGLAVAADEPRKEAYDLKGEAGCVEGAIVRTFKNEKVIELKVEKVLNKDEKGTYTPKDDSTKMDEKKDTEKGFGALKPGQVIYLHVADCRVVDEKGKELKRDDKEAWFTRDAGWAALDEGRRVKVEFSGTHEMPAPKDFPRDARAGGNIIVYHATMLHILAKD
jgi:hypothetical protein